MNAYVIKIFLYEVEPLIWRRVSVPETASFAEFHQIIQKAMGWSDDQAHQFRYGKGKSLTSVISDTQEQVAPGDDYQNEKDITLADFARRRRLPIRLMYRYDFFDEWTHEIVFEEKTESSDAPMLLGGGRACPPEDCGGSFGYKECMQGYAEWMDDDYDPETFDLDAWSGGL